MTGGGFRTAGLSSAESLVFLGGVPEPPNTEEHVVAATTPGKPGEITTTRVFIRAESVPGDEVMELQGHTNELEVKSLREIAQSMRSG